MQTIPNQETAAKVSRFKNKWSSYNFQLQKIIKINKTAENLGHLNTLDNEITPWCWPQWKRNQFTCLKRTYLLQLMLDYNWIVQLNSHLSISDFQLIDVLEYSDTQLAGLIQPTKIFNFCRCHAMDAYYAS